MLSRVTSQEGWGSELKSKLLLVYVGGRESSRASAPGRAVYEGPWQNLAQREDGTEFHAVSLGLLVVHSCWVCVKSFNNKNCTVNENINLHFVF